MKTRPLFVLLVLATMVASVASCQCSRSQQQEVTETPAQPTLVEQSFQLANGLDVDMMTGPCGDSAALVVLLNIGIDHDPVGRSGMAQLVARILATSGAPGRAVRTVETGSDYLMYSVVATGDKLLDEVDEVAAWMSQGSPTGASLEADLTRERTRLLEELAKLQGNDAMLTAVSLAQEAVLPTRGNGKRFGVAAEVEAITLGELQTYWQGQIKPGNARIAMAGKFDAKKVRERIQAGFATLASGSPAVLRDAGEATVKGTLVMGEKPSAVAIAIPAPPWTDALYAPFLVLASRLLEKPAEPRTWQVEFDPIRRPDILLVTGLVGQTEQPEPAAGRIRDEMAKIVGAPLASGDMTATKERFRSFLTPNDLHPETCAKDARGFAIARVRGKQLKLDAPALRKALEGVTKTQLEEAGKLFGAKQSAAVIAGGAIR